MWRRLSPEGCAFPDKCRVRLASEKAFGPQFFREATLCRVQAGLTKASSFPPPSKQPHTVPACEQNSIVVSSTLSLLFPVRFRPAVLALQVNRTSRAVLLGIGSPECLRNAEWTVCTSEGQSCGPDKRLAWFSLHHVGCWKLPHVHDKNATEAACGLPWFGASSSARSTMRGNQVYSYLRALLDRFNFNS